jgi:hypothetical protein
MEGTMKHLLLFIALMSTISGCCATPVVMDNGNQSKVFVPCTDNNLCFRDSYSVAWDNSHSCYERDYPVSYRAKQSEYESNRVEYILLPKSDAANGGAQ